MDFGTVIDYLFLIPAALITLSVHECAHGYAAYKMGDPTARNFGRLTLNPFKHLDLYGTICMVLFHFGWAKPVPINARNFKDPRKGMAITAAAGPASNLLLAFLAAICIKFLALLAGTLIPQFQNDVLFYFFYYLIRFFELFHVLNLSLCVFNLIPLPPLDGSRIFLTFLPPRLYFKVMRYERVIQIALMVALFFGAFSGVIQTVVEWLSAFMFKILFFIP